MLVSSYSSVDRCDVGDVVLQCGITLTNVQLVVSVYGCRERLDNVIVFPTRFGGTHQDNEYLISEGMASVGATTQVADAARRPRLHRWSAQGAP